MNFRPEQFLQDLKIAFRSLGRAKGLAITVVLTLALGIGANAAIFSLVRGVLLRPLVNADENHLIYIRQSAMGIGSENVTFSVPEIQDLKASVKSISEFGDFSQIGFTMTGLGEPREVRAGVVGGSYFEVMGLHPGTWPAPRRPSDDGPKAAGAVVLDLSLLVERIQERSHGPLAKPSGWAALAHVRRPLSGSSSLPFRILRKRKLSRMW